MSGDKLKELMKFTVFTGTMSEVHIESMKRYPFIFLDGVDEAEISYNIPTMGQRDEKSYVNYTLKFKEGFPQGDMKDGIENIKKAIKVLMQHEISVGVFNAQGKQLG